MQAEIAVINPNSTQRVTDGIDRSIEPLRFPSGPVIRCHTLHDGPPGIQSQRDADGVVLPLLKAASVLEDRVAAFVIACFSDPGIHSLREQSRRPVFGIAECGILTALTMGQRFGIIAILPASVQRHARYIRSMGLDGRMSAELPIGLSIPQLADRELALERMIATGRRLVHEHSSDVVVMGCAGMAEFRSDLEAALDVPVVEPTQAAVSMAIGRVRCGSSASAGPSGVRL